MHLLDSNILIYASKPGGEFLNTWIISKDARVSAISLPEVLGYPGLNAQDEAVFDRWFADLRRLDVTEPILRRAAALRRERRMKLGDAIVAATALTHDLELVTRNVEDFKHVAGLRVINPFDSGV
ncbi:MAG: type II toxin-antitoxin system VapC family toxin [Verrucomicrobiota bacterium]|jgi:predicted nucleic acid-binding protein